MLTGPTVWQFGLWPETKGGNMKPRMLVLMSAIALFAVLATPIRRAAQEPQQGAEGEGLGGRHDSCS